MTPRDIVVCGAGVIGLSSAYFLLEQGHRVTVLERGGPDHDCCSIGNCGYISPSHIVPLAAPGIVPQALRWMGNPESPFYVRLRPDPGLIRWGFRFWRSSTAERARRAAPLLRDLNLQSRALFETLAERTGNEFGLERQGLLMLFRSERALREELDVAARARDLGMPAEPADRARIAALEPTLALAPDVVGGVYYPRDAHVVPQKFVRTLERLVSERGGVIRWNHEVTAFARNGSGLKAAVTPHGEVRADEVVVAGGTATAAMLHGLGRALPLQPGKGYSLTLERPPRRPTRSVLLGEARVAITPMGEALRVGGTMELGATGLEISPPRIRGILSSLTRYLPDFKAEQFAEIRPWSGLRPLTPDGLPYVGRWPGIPNLTVATGHAMMGLSMGPITGSLVSDIVCGRTPSVDVAPLAPGRFF